MHSESRACQIYKLINSSNLRLCRKNRFMVSDDVIQKVQRHHDLIKTHAYKQLLSGQRATMQLI